MANHVRVQPGSTAVIGPVIAPGHDFETVTEAVAQIPRRRARRSDGGSDS